MKSDTIKIGTWPTPEKPLSVEIPLKFLEEFKKEARIVIRHPWIIGIPVPDVLLNKLMKEPQVQKEVMENFEIMLIPK